MISIYNSPFLGAYCRNSRISRLGKGKVWWKLHVFIMNCRKPNWAATNFVLCIAIVYPPRLSVYHQFDNRKTE